VHDLIGKVVGGYRLVEPLATGGMGFIFRAESEDAQRRVAAVKMLRGLSPQANEERRFEREARASLRLRHPNITETWDFGRTPDGTAYLVMECLRGQDLRDRIASGGTLSAAEAIRIGRLAGAGLAYAHRNGVVHRDLKPENIFLCETAPRGSVGDFAVKILDFGLALLAEDRVRLTAIGTSLGTPSYMSPEQVRGQHEESVVTDVWGLGAVLYHGLTGAPPFEAETSLGEMVRVLTDEPVPLPVARPDLPATLVEVVRRAMRKKPSDRWPTMQAMIDAFGPEESPTLPDLRVSATAPPAGDEPPASWGFDAAAGTLSQELAAPLLEEVRLISVVVADLLFDARPFVEAVRAHGGQGEVLLAGRAAGIFGGSHWEGDEPERAVRAALQAVISSPHARIGVGTGRAVRTAGAEVAITGAAVASAERAAQIGAVGVDDETARRVRGGFSIRPPGGAGTRGAGGAGGTRAAGGAAGGAGGGGPGGPERPRAARGAGAGAAGEDARGVGSAGAAFASVAAPPPSRGGSTHVVVEAKPQIGVIGIRGVGGREIPTVGRERELARLRAALDATLAEGTARALLVVGPQGSGKSRLRYELEVMVEEHPQLVSYVAGKGEHGRPAGAYAALAHALRRRARIPLGIPRSAARERLVKLMRGAIGDPAEADDAARFVGEILGANFAPTPALTAARADAALMGHRVRQAMDSYFRALAATKPLVLMMEDLQWVDPATVELLERLLGALHAYPVLVVGTARPDVLADYPDVLGAAAERIELGPLDLAASAALVSAVIEAPSLPDELTRRLHALAAGNPYFLEELALHVRERGVERSLAEHFDLPTTVQGTVQSRLDRLAAEEKELLKRASILGQRFWAEALDALGAPAPSDLLVRLRRRELLDAPVGADAGGLHEWSFKNPIVREVAYGMLTEKQRRRLHAAAAKWISERLEDRPGDVAAHLDLAGELDGGAKYWALAAERAARQGDVGGTLALSEKALERDALSPRRALRLRLLREEALALLGRRDDQEGELVQADALVEAGDQTDTADRAEVARRWARLHRLTGRVADARAAATRALELAPDAAARASVLAERSVLETDAGRAAEGAEFARAAQAAAEEAASEVALAAALEAGAHAHARAGELEEAVAGFERAAAWLETAGDVRRALGARVAAEAARLRLGRHAEVGAALDELVGAARAAGNAAALGLALLHLGVAHWRAGAGRTVEAATDAIAIARATRSPRMWIAALVYRALMQLDAGRRDAARADAEEARRLAAGLQDGLEADARTALASVLLAAGDARAALAECAAALAVRDRTGALEHLEAELFALLAAVLEQLGDDAQAADVTGAARARLLAHAGRIAREEDRNVYLDATAAHRRLMR